jgi:Undecaprenyl-phosphate glucose phosphotransferase
MVDMMKMHGELQLSARKFYHNWQFILNALRLCDVVAVMAAGEIVGLLHFGTLLLGPGEWLFLYFSAIATLVALQLAGSYRASMLSKLDEQLSALFKGGIGTVLALLIGGFITGALGNYSRAWIVGAVTLGAMGLICNRVMMRLVMQRIIASGHMRENVVLVGLNERAEKLIANLNARVHPEVTLLGLFDDRLTRTPPSFDGLPLLGSIDDLLTYVRAKRVDRVVVTLPWTADARILELLKRLRTVPVQIDLVPHDMIWRIPSADIARLAGIPIITVANCRVDEQIGALKRIEDVVLASALLLLTGPAMLLISLAVKLDSRGPILFRQQRHGFNNEVFDVFKFRTMKMAPEPDLNLSQATRNDPRVTRVGRILRRLSLDELPQLLNVLGGSMSVVGPRPHALQHNFQFADVIDEYFARHNVKPGITGWAQINGLRGETDTDDKMRKRVEHDLHYIEHWSLLFDFKIVLMTAIVTVWPQENAY